MTASRLERTAPDEARLAEHLASLYGSAVASKMLPRFREAIGQAGPRVGARSLQTRLDERSAVLITYADQVSEPGAAPIATLTQLLDATVGDVISHVHLLPFFPFSSDDGFSVVDYEQVDPRLGGWSDIERMAGRFGLMVDLVLNHVSVASRWFRAFLAGASEFRDFFVTVDEGVDVSCVVRPRTLPVVSTFRKATGEPVRVWTTFSGDQADLNYRNPEVLLRMVQILLDYVAHGIQMVRLDAVGFLWKEPGTPSIHLPQTHEIVRLLRAVLDIVAPDVLIVSETNVPHDENVSYFGDGRNEAQLVYQFPLPPLVLSAFVEADASPLRDWLLSIDPAPEGATFLNFLASHDGIGLRPVEGVLAEARVEALIRRTLAHGGRVSYRTDEDGRDVAYELNIAYFDALSDPGLAASDRWAVDRFLAAHAMMLCLAGVPGLYFHSLFGSRSWTDGVRLRGSHRAINREKLTREDLERDLADPRSIRRRVLDGFRCLLRARSSCAAFDPASPQRVLASDPRIFAVLRGEPDGEAGVCCLHNVSGEPVTVQVEEPDLGFAVAGRWFDLIGRRRFDVADGTALSVVVQPYESLWLTRKSA